VRNGLWHYGCKGLVGDRSGLLGFIDDRGGRAKRVFRKGDSAAYENSVADLTRRQPLSNRPNELSFLIETGRLWCADKVGSKQKGTPEERQTWLANLRQNNYVDN
jgi:hypothetical protein